MTSEDYLDERFELRQAMQIARASCDTTMNLIKDARTMIDNNEWQDSIVNLRTAHEMLQAIPGAYERLDKTLIELIKKIEENHKC